MMERTTNSVDETRFHEAGHVVSGYILGIRAESVEGLRTTFYKRTVAFMGNSSFNTAYLKRRGNAFATILCAGIAAESKASGISLDELRAVSGITDYPTINVVLNKLGIIDPEARAAQIVEWEARAATIIASNWAAVDAVARELLESEEEDEYVHQSQFESAITAAPGITPVKGTGYWDYLDLYINIDKELSIWSLLPQ